MPTACKTARTRHLDHGLQRVADTVHLFEHVAIRQAAIGTLNSDRGAATLLEVTVDEISSGIEHFISGSHNALPILAETLLVA